jgi:hypothetical protein
VSAPAPGGDQPGRDRAGLEPGAAVAGWEAGLLGLLLLVFGVTLLLVLVALWPAVQPVQPANGAAAGSQDATRTVWLFGAVRLRLRTDTALLLVAIAAGALGACVHVATSFATFVGNQRFKRSWIWWYVMRPLIGAALALFFYAAVRGGIMTSQAGSGDVNPYGVVALAALVGLFSKQATDKLREVFETLFRTGEGYGDDERRDKATFPKPVLVAVEPPQVRRAEHASLRLRGEGFVAESTVRVTHVDTRPSEVVTSQRVVSRSEIALEIEAAYLDVTGQLEIAVVNPTPGGGSSDPIRIPVQELTELAVGTPRR